MPFLPFRTILGLPPNDPEVVVLPKQLSTGAPCAALFLTNASNRTVGSLDFSCLIHYTKVTSSHQLTKQYNSLTYCACLLLISWPPLLSSVLHPNHSEMTSTYQLVEDYHRNHLFPLFLWCIRSRIVCIRVNSLHALY